MKEFVLLFRMDITSPEAQPSPRQMELDMVDWIWLTGWNGLTILPTKGNWRKGATI